MVSLNGHSLTLEQVVAVARRFERVELAAKGAEHAGGQTLRAVAPIERIPMFQRAGSHPAIDMSSRRTFP